MSEQQKGGGKKARRRKQFDDDDMYVVNAPIISAMIMYIFIYIFSDSELLAIAEEGMEKEVKSKENVTPPTSHINNTSGDKEDWLVILLINGNGN